MYHYDKMEAAEMIGSLNRFFTLLTAIITLFLFMGCVTTGGNSGKLKYDRELDDAFERYQVLPDHNYYITGGYSAPAAILAIHKDYQLENAANLWVGVPNVSSTQIEGWVENISPEENLRERNQYWASYVLDPEGKRVGAWYSYQKITTVEFLEENGIKVYTPNPEPMRRQRRRGR
jgi:hypothetical protein